MRTLIVFICVTLAACQSRSKSSVYVDTLFSKGVAQGTVSKKLIEASGLVESANNPGMFWSHNDSGNPAELFLIDKKGETKMICLLENADNRDWEDIAIGPGPDGEGAYVYVGDIGDNMRRYKTKYIYRLKEPLFDADKKIISGYDTIAVTLSDGVRDTEALMIDPISKDLFLISKWEDSVGVYRVSFPYQKENIAQRIVNVPFHKIVAADISASGEEVLLKTYDDVYYWKRLPGESIADLLKRKPMRLPYQREFQGESIGFARDSSGYYTLGESTKNKRAELMFYQRLEQPAAPSPNTLNQ
jgi:hypothetical protein